MFWRHGAIIFFLACVPFTGKSQIRISGNVKDTSSGKGVPNVVVMALRFGDSTLAGYGRTDAKGILHPFKVSRDTFIIVFSHPQFSDKVYLILPSEKDSILEFRNVI